MCAAFCMTDYKIQGSTLKNAVLDLKDDPTTKGQDGHKKFCSRYDMSSCRGLKLKPD
jgi:hypothetical protein